MVGIIIRPSGYSRKSGGTAVFTPHFNRELGKYYKSSKDYYGDMKKKGYVPYDPNIKQKERAPYKASKWARGVINEIKNQTVRGKFKPSERLMDEITQRKKRKAFDMSKLPKHYQKGGIE